MSVLKKLAGQTAIYGLSHILSRVLFFVVFTIYLTRKVSTTDYGIYSDLYANTTLILALLVFRLDTAFFRYGSGDQDKERALSTILLPLTLACLVVVLIMTVGDQAIANMLSYPDAPHYVRWFAWIFALDAIGTIVYAKLRLYNRPMRFLVYKLINVAITVVLVLFFMEYAPIHFPELYKSVSDILGVRRSIDFVFFSNLCASGLVLLFMIPEFPKRWTYDGDMFRSMIIYSLPLVIVSLAGNINQYFATPIQKHFLGDNIMENLSNAGVYAAAAKIAILLNLFTTAFNYAAEPFFFNNAHKEDSRRQYGKIALAFTLFATLVAVGICLYLDVVGLIVGERFRSQDIVPILLFSYVLLGLYYNIGIWYKLSDKTIYGAIISIGGAIITLVISIALLPSIGTIASAYAALACYLFMVILGYYLGQKHYPIDYPMKKIGTYIIAGMIVTGVFRYYVLAHTTPTVYYLLATLAMLLFLYVIYKKEAKDLLKLD